MTCYIVNEAEEKQENKKDMQYEKGEGRNNEEVTLGKEMPFYSFFFFPKE